MTTLGLDVLFEQSRVSTVSVRLPPDDFAKSCAFGSRRFFSRDESSIKSKSSVSNSSHQYPAQTDTR